MALHSPWHMPGAQGTPATPWHHAKTPPPQECTGYLALPGELPCHPTNYKGLLGMLPTLAARPGLRRYHIWDLQPLANHPGQNLSWRSPHCPQHPRLEPGLVIRLIAAHCPNLARVQNTYRTDVTLNNRLSLSFISEGAKIRGLREKHPGSEIPPRCLHSTRGCPGRGWHLRTHQAVEGMNWVF